MHANKGSLPDTKSAGTLAVDALDITASAADDAIQVRIEKAERERSSAQAAEVAALQKFYAANAQIKALEAQVVLLQNQVEGNSADLPPGVRKGSHSFHALKASVLQDGASGAAVGLAAFLFRKGQLFLTGP